ncbi:MAG TPA: CinA family protein [Candidatus Gastranaerophilaceae bacterium]|nr:CinA family protein [Candidatus Gastranaerophilaceae bacterium]HPT40847.1 CinA family protein [Candidatus Gastranaerophilaceae bacterium]
MNKFFESLDLIYKKITARTEKKVARFLLKNSMTLSVAESCTGGLLSSRLTDIAGSSAYTKENYITYANEAKIKLLSVTPQTIEKYGAVSEECALEMVKGLFEKTGCDISIATTGIAGPGGINENKDAGLLFVAIKSNFSSAVRKFELNPKISRKKMKFLFTQKALEFLLEFLSEKSNIKY